MYSRETQKYIYALIDEFSENNGIERIEAKDILKETFLKQKYGEKKLKVLKFKKIVEIEKDFFIICGTFTLSLNLVSQKIADEFANFIKSNT